MEFKIIKKNKRWFFRDLYILCGICLPIFFYFLSIQDGWIGIVIMIILLFVFDVAPGLYLYNEYMQINREAVLCIDIENCNVSYTGITGSPISISSEEIKLIAIYISPNRYKGNLTLLEMERFSYARFELKDGRVFYVTSLMIPKLRNFAKEYFPETPVILHRWWVFPSIRLSNYFKRECD